MTPSHMTVVIMKMLVSAAKVGDIGYQSIIRGKIRQSEYIHSDLHVLLHLTVLNIFISLKIFLTSYSSTI